MQCVVDVLLLLLLLLRCQMCAAAGRACKFACMFVRTLLLASDVVIDLVFAALAACLCGLLIRSARHGTADNDDGHVDDATRLPACVWRRVLGGFGGRPLGRAQMVRLC